MDIWVKHENHSPVGAFKIRGGLVYFAHLAQSGQLPKGVICATRGNHGQAVAYAARRYGVPVTIVVPHGNSVEKNAAICSGLGHDVGDEVKVFRILRFPRVIDHGAFPMAFDGAVFDRETRWVTFVNLPVGKIFSVKQGSISFF